MQLYSAAVLKTRLKRYDDAGPEGLWRPAIEMESPMDLKIEMAFSFISIALL